MRPNCQDLLPSVKFHFAKNPFSIFQHFETQQNVPPLPIEPNFPHLLKSLCKMGGWHSLCFYQMQLREGICEIEANG